MAVMDGVSARRSRRNDGQAGESVMTGGSSELDPCVVIVGDSRCEFVRAMVRLARDCQIQAVRCEDVYFAVVAMARAGGRPVFVVGVLRELAREKGRFFRIAEANAQRCCCLVDPDPSLDAEAILAAIRTGMCVVGAVEEVEPVLTDWLSGGGRRSRHKGLDGLRDEDLHATEAELIALLGRQGEA